MRKKSYQCGDTVYLKPGVLGNSQPTGPARVISVMPEGQGVVRLRVRFQHENFERSVAVDEIDAPASATSAPRMNEGPAVREAGSSWINLNSIKIRK